MSSSLDFAHKLTLVSRRLRKNAPGGEKSIYDIYTDLTNFNLSQAQPEQEPLVEVEATIYQLADYLHLRPPL